MRAPLTAAALLMSAVLLGSSCPAPVPQEPQITLHGQLRSSTAASLSNPVRLAVGWYPTWMGTPKGPKSIIVSQATTLSGSFPVDFSFQLKGRPPADALVDLAETGGEGVIAYGFLIAYEDGNGNGELDLATATTPSPDRIVGISDGDPSLPPPLHHYFVVYADGRQGPDSYMRAFDLPVGYALLEGHSNYGVRMVPPETSVGIEVTNTDALQVFGCPDLDFNLWFSKSCGIDPFGGKYVISGALYEWREATFEIDDAHGVRSDATVLLNGTPLTFDAASAKYGGVRPVVGANTVQFDVPGHPSETITVNVPAPPNLTTAIPAQAQSGAQLTVAWSDDPAVELYDVHAYTQEATQYFFHDNLNANSFTTGPINYEGWVWVSVLGLAPISVGPNGGYVTGVSRTGGWVNFVR
jgi:hypothetical protein